MNAKSNSNVGVFLALLWALTLYAVWVLAEYTPSPLGNFNTFSTFHFILIIFLSLSGLLILFFSLAIFLKGQNLSQHPHAFALPKGSVRAILALSLVFGFITISIFFVNKVPQLKSNGEETIDLINQILSVLSTAFVTVLGFYFGSRSSTPIAEPSAQEIKEREDLKANETNAKNKAAQADIISMEIIKLGHQIGRDIASFKKHHEESGVPIGPTHKMILQAAEAGQKSIEKISGQAIQRVSTIKKEEEKSPSSPEERNKSQTAMSEQLKTLEDLRERATAEAKKVGLAIRVSAS